MCAFAFLFVFLIMYDHFYHVFSKLQKAVINWPFNESHFNWMQNFSKVEKGKNS